MRCRTNLISKFVSPLLVILLVGMSAVAAGDELGIWDNGASAWTDTFAEGDYIDTGTFNEAWQPAVAIDSSGRAYVTFAQSDGVTRRIYLSRSVSPLPSPQPGSGGEGGDGCFIMVIGSN